MNRKAKIGENIAVLVTVIVFFFVWASAPIITLTPWFPHARGISGILSIFWGLLFLLLFACMLDGMAPGYEIRTGGMSVVLGIQMTLSLACWGFVVFTHGATAVF